jgi:UrcA family protein
MNTKRKTFAVAAVACGFVISAAAAEPTPEITVLGTRTMVNVKTERDPLNPTPLSKTFSLSYGVSIKDLDLASASGATELEKRVNDSALAICKEIGRQYPESGPDDATCAKLAAKKAMVKARELIAAAHKAPAK